MTELDSSVAKAVTKGMESGMLSDSGQLNHLLDRPLQRTFMDVVDLKQQTVSIENGKGGKSRLLPTGQYAGYYIEQYVSRARKYLLYTTT